MRFCKLFFFLLVLLQPFSAFCGAVNFTGESILLGPYIDVAEDTASRFGFENVSQLGSFVKNYDETPNFGLSKSTYWIKFNITNKTDENKLLLELAYPMIDYCALYSPGDDTTKLQYVSENKPFNDRDVKQQNIVFEVRIAKGETKAYYLKLRGNEQIVVPLIIRSQKGFIETSLTNEVITGLHVGLLLVMILYNLFVYFSIKDKSYLFYVLYILFIGLTQTTITGHTFKYLWPNSPYFNNVAIILMPALAGIFAICFFKNFLHTKEKTPLLDKVLNIMAVIYTTATVLRLAGMDMLSYRFIDVAGLVATLTGFAIALKLSLQGYRPAKFFLLAWSIFLIGIILFVLRNLNILPYNIYTNYTMQAGTGLEVILLSFALADKINILQKKEEASQKLALEASKENERIIKEQNVVLELSVAERTKKLSTALNDLQEAQAQLIDAEKMASLGQLTAGIAHEINNPINFVSSNIKPLKRDIEDLMEILANYDELADAGSIEEVKAKIKAIDDLKEDLDIEYIKTELDMLLKGMEEGANRTVEIVKGLKIFSRVDESDLKFVNINEGLEVTLILLNSQMGGRVKLVKELNSMPDVECYAGKLNQVFMNILTNSIYAITEQSMAEKTPTIWIKTWLEGDSDVCISIRDNGAGMSAEVKTKIFNPFYTTKEVGKGTGLGLSIVFKIIEAHKGSIQVNSEVGIGTDFLIKIPRIHK